MKIFINLHVKEIKKNTIHFTEKTRMWCSLPYTTHRHGCPNFNKVEECPNKFPYIENFIKTFNKFILVYVVFEFKEYKKMMKLIHPDWSERQLGNSLWWQGHVKKIIRMRIEEIYKKNDPKKMYLLHVGSGLKKKNSIITKHQKLVPSMEGAGVHVFKTLKNNNIYHEIKPITVATEVALICIRNGVENSFKYE
jgi:predicted metal-binding protein